jgi:hypothetical protein
MAPMAELKIAQHYNQQDKLEVAVGSTGTERSYWTWFQELFQLRF